ncbi:hypothetical protein AGMMS49941_12070 [Deferribacterales bacterium]|nr:hypothetical protein AGMMS49941_12070 [Deferribacterales bacterium]
MPAAIPVPAGTVAGAFIVMALGIAPVSVYLMFAVTGVAKFVPAGIVLPENSVNAAVRV